MVRKIEKEEWSDIVAKFGPPRSSATSQSRLMGYAANIKQIDFRIRQLSKRRQDLTLITGPSGTGKTTVVKCLASDYAKENPRFHFFYLECSWTLEKLFGDARSSLNLLFSEAIEKSPSLIFIDELDHICNEKRNEPKDRVFNILKERIKMLKSSKAKVLVLAATNKPDAIDSQIRDLFYVNEIAFALPDRQDRIEMLEVLTKENGKELTSEDLQRIADSSHCYLYDNLKELCQIAEDVCESKQVSMKEAFDVALLRYRPLKIRSITSPCPPLRWTDIGGVDNVKRELQRSVIWPLVHRDKFKEMGIKSRKGALLYGPPGCSKTMLAQALATESGYNFILIKGSEVLSKWVGDSEARIRRLYREAREIAPCIIFFDEFEALAPKRGQQGSQVSDKVVAALLIELDGIDPLENVFTIAATNAPHCLDKALLRPGRLYPAIYIPLPSQADRYEIFKVHMRPLPLKFDMPHEDIIDDLVKRTHGYSGSEIAEVCQGAASLVLDESLENKHIEWKHFQASLERVKPQTGLDQLKSYRKFSGAPSSQKVSLKKATNKFNKLTIRSG